MTERSGRRLRPPPDEDYAHMARATRAPPARGRSGRWRKACKGVGKLRTRARVRSLARLAMGMLGSVLMLPSSAAVAAASVVMQPAVADYQQLSTSATPPTQAQCNSVNRRCFSPQAVYAAYNLSPLYASGKDGTGTTIAIVDSFGSDTISHDLNVFNTAFGLPHMCGEDGVACATGMPTFSQLHLEGSPATKPNPGKNSTGQEDKSAWALEVSLDVEWAHAIAPGANILLVNTPTAETLGVQGFPNFMNAEQYVVDHHLANIITQSFGSAEDAFGSFNSLLNLRHAFVSAAASNVTVLASSGDNGTANIRKTPVKNPQTIPFPTVSWPASDPLVTGVGGTYLCTDANN